MTFTRTISSRLLLCAFTLGACATVSAAGTPSDTDAKARYATDVARCKAGQTNQDQATCLREAGAALEESQRNRLTNKNSNFDQNQVDRCNSLPASERSDCLQQMSGANTTTQGSISSGGVMRETTIPVAPGTPGSTTVPASPAAPSTSMTPSANMPATPSAPASPAMPAAPATPVPGTGVTQ